LFRLVNEPEIGLTGVLSEVLNTLGFKLATDSKGSQRTQSRCDKPRYSLPLGGVDFSLRRLKNYPPITPISQKLAGQFQ